MTTFEDLQSRSKVRTAFEPEEFIEAYTNANNRQERKIVRGVFRSLDQGRFYDFLEQAHKVVAHSDLDRRESFEENYSDHLIEWIRAYGYVEDLAKFPEMGT